MKERLNALLPDKTLRIWNELTAGIDLLYDVDRLWDKGFGPWEIEYKYRRGGKTLCTLYAKKDAAELLITYGKAEREKFEDIQDSFSPSILAIYNAAEVLHDGKWLWFPLDENLLLSDVTSMLKIKRRPNRK